MKRPAIFALLLAAVLTGCAPADQRLEQLAAQADRACEMSVEHIDPRDFFRSEAQICYGYRAVNDRPLNWRDVYTITGKGRFGFATFEVDRGRIEGDAAVVLFPDRDYVCEARENLRIVRDRFAELTIPFSGACVWVVQTG
ncbi:MAG: lipoprotein [Terricaulis sp.]